MKRKKMHRDKLKPFTFKEGDRLFIRFPDSGERIVLEAVKAKSDAYYCEDCILYSKCSQYFYKSGASPFSRSCSTTIFEEKRK